MQKKRFFILIIGTISLIVPIINNLVIAIGNYNLDSIALSDFYKNQSLYANSITIRKRTLGYRESYVTKRDTVLVTKRNNRIASDIESKEETVKYMSIKAIRNVEITSRKL